MSRVRFNLSTLLVLFTLLAITFGLGYQIHLLRRQVAELKGDVQSLKQSPKRFLYQPSTIRFGQNSPFRLLNSQVVVNPTVENGLKASELQQQRRIERHLRDDISFVQQRAVGIGRRLRGDGEQLRRVRAQLGLVVADGL